MVQLLLADTLSKPFPSCMLFPDRPEPSVSISFSFSFLFSAGGKTHHAKQPPSRLARLSTNTQPVLCAVNVELDVLELFRRLVAVGGRSGNGIVCAEDFERFAAACGSV